MAMEITLREIRALGYFPLATKLGLKVRTHDGVVEGDSEQGKGVCSAVV